MPETPVYLSRFVRRVYGRMLVWRALESAGVGLFVGCIVVLIASCAAIYRGRPADGLVLWFLPLASFGGAAWFLWRRPHVLDAAMEADRQLGLSDLLSTAWVLRHDAVGDAFPAAVMATAEARCAGL
ncbi:MAG TPA: hypothetical protein VHP11_07540, partial [Tepidisphaeraceae bacterium]|nr:hypothetical protein [Tepidisphaeraceae bacterium]